MDQNQNDLAAALGGAPVVPGPAATSLDPALAVPAETPQPGVIGPVEVPQQQPQQPVQQPQQPVAPQQPVQQPIQPVAPNAPGTQPFVNPLPEQGINEPVQLDQYGRPIPVVAPANQPAPVSPQAEAQAQQQKELAEPPTVQELAECSNILRATLPAGAGPRVAALLDRVAEQRIQQEQAQQFQEQPQQFAAAAQQPQSSSPQGPYVSY